MNTKQRTKSSTSAKVHPKRRGHHQRHTKDFLKTYWPYMPTLLMLLFGLSISFGWQWQPQPRTQVGTNGGVLAYATNVSITGLLSETNSRRTSNGKNVLSVNAKLNQAAQAKANDMATRDYWSHNTPEGSPPWIFIDQTGYAYQKAGENLAYGFATSTETITGWMNSPSHKDNMLDDTFLEVGFGMANSENYQGYGQQTIVVAMYAKPTMAAAAAAPTTPAPVQSPPPTPAAQPVPAPASISPVMPDPVPDAQTVAQSEKSPDKTNESETIPAATAENLDTPTRSVARVQLITGGTMPWTSFGLSMLSAILVTVIGLRHIVALKRVIRHGEQFILGHPLLDFAIVSLFTVSVYLNLPVGLIR